MESSDFIFIFGKWNITKVDQSNWKYLIFPRWSPQWNAFIIQKSQGELWMVNDKIQTTQFMDGVQND